MNLDNNMCSQGDQGELMEYNFLDRNFNWVFPVIMIVIVLLLLVLSPVQAYGADILIDSYASANSDGDSELYSGSNIRRCQSVHGSTYYLTSMSFWLKKSGSPTGTAVATVYAHSGTYGTNSVGTGSALVTSDTLDVSTLTTSYQSISFTFSTTPYYLFNTGADYVICVEYSGGNASNKVLAGRDGSTPSHSGNYSYYASSWTGINTYDRIFYLYGTTTDGTVSEGTSSTTTTDLTGDMVFSMAMIGFLLCFIFFGLIFNAFMK